jgi:hypothetical protein
MIFIMALIGAQACCTTARRKWMCLWIACALLSGGCIAAELYQAFAPKAERDILGRFENSSPM